MKMRSLRFTLLGLTILSRAFAQEHGQEGHAQEGHGSAGHEGAAHEGHGQSTTTSAAVAHDEHGEGHGGAHEVHHPLDSINWFDIYGKDSEGKPQVPMLALVVNFVLLLMIFKKAASGGLSTFLKNRRKEIGNAILNARRLFKEAKERANQYQGQLATLETDSAATRTTMLETGEAEKKKIIADAEEKAARLQKDASFLLEQERKQMSADLYRETVERAVKDAEEMLRKRMTLSDHERLAEDFLTQILVKRTSMPPAARPSLSPPRGSTPPPANQGPTGQGGTST